MPRKRKTRPKSSVDDYAVGYRRPPAHTRFQPGQSGNAKGRPAGSANLATLIAKALAEKVPVTEGGRRRTISKGEAIAKQVVNKAASGDLRALRLLVPSQNALASGSRQTEPNTQTDASAPSPPTPSIDFSKLTTAELRTIYEAALILEGREKERPPSPLPPGDPDDEPGQENMKLK